MVLDRLTDGVARGFGTAAQIADQVTEAALSPFSDPVVRLGVTGLNRSGKTVFITALVANLLDRGRMPGLRGAAIGAIQTAYLQPQPDDTVPRFPFEDHLSALTGPAPTWPDSTQSVSQLRLSLKVAPKGMLAPLQGQRTVHLDIVDYPGEWLLDLALLDLDYATWSTARCTRMAEQGHGEAFLAAARAADPAAMLDEATARALAEGYTAAQHAARAAGFSDCGPGRFLLPGEMAGSPVLTFAPLPNLPARAPRGSLAREMERRFEAYKSRVVRPFFQDHFAKIDRQVVLADVLGAIHAGPAALEDLRRTLAEILSAFRPGRNAWLASLLRGKRVEKILFAATKADHLHHEQHGALTAITQALLREAEDRARFAGAKTRALAIAALRTTVEETRNHQGRDLGVVRGHLLDTGKAAAFYPGALPDDPARLLSPARTGEEAWLDGEYAVMRFAPAPLRLKPGDGPPHIRLDTAAEFLFGDRLA